MWSLFFLLMALGRDELARFTGRFLVLLGVPTCTVSALFLLQGSWTYAPAAGWAELAGLLASPGPGGPELGGARAHRHTIWGVTDVADARARLLTIIKDKAIVHGRVTLSSGREGNYYVDLRRVSLDGEAAPLVGIVMRDLTQDLSYAAVGGLTLGADPVATAMLHAAAASGDRLDAFVVRKAGKAHGLQQRIEGPSISGRDVLVVEDTTTTGASPLSALEAVRAAGARPVAVATIADRATGADEVIRAAGVEYRYAYSLAELGLA